MKFRFAWPRAVFTLPLLCGLLGSSLLYGAEEANLQAIKAFLVQKTEGMTKGARSFQEHATAYAKLVADHGGDYEQTALTAGEAMKGLIGQMQEDYREIHNTGYESIEGITAGTKRFVQFDLDLDAGVPRAEATTDSPAAALVLKDEAGKVLVERQGNLFHFIMEPALWRTRAHLAAPLSPAAAAQTGGLKSVPRADIVLASAKECTQRLEQLHGLAEAWQPSLDECVGALVWMTPTLNGYFEDWKDSRYNPGAALGRYVAESRVLDMKGIMSSLQLTYEAVQPEVAKKDPALAKRLQGDYAGIMHFLARVDEREQKGKKLTVLEIEEMANQAKGMTDQLAPKLKQVVALLKLKLPPKPGVV